MKDQIREYRIREIEILLEEAIRETDSHSVRRLRQERLEVFRELCENDKELTVHELQSQSHYDMMVDVVDGDTVSEQIVNMVRDLACALVVGTFFRLIAQESQESFHGLTEAEFNTMILKKLRKHRGDEPSEDETKKFYEVMKFYQQECESWINETIENN